MKITVYLFWSSFFILVFWLFFLFSYAYAGERKVEITAYSSIEKSVGNITASGQRTRKGIIAVSHDLFKNGFHFGTRVYVKGHGVFEVQDLMSKRWTNRIDIYCDSWKEMKKIGKQKSIIRRLN